MDRGEGWGAIKALGYSGIDTRDGGAKEAVGGSSVIEANGDQGISATGDGNEAVGRAASYFLTGRAPR